VEIAASSLCGARASSLQAQMHRALLATAGKDACRPHRLEACVPGGAFDWKFDSRLGSTGHFTRRRISLQNQAAKK